ncbi:MAG TPA: hypothetical protein VFP34_13080 [Microlunatus sp.]|nr:hypothetical protein [Microlunatus sp.]
MSDFSTRPDDVPAEDWAEQLQDADPAREEEAELEPAAGRRDAAEADDADLAEQRSEVFLEEE